MAIKFSCRGCRRRLRVPERGAGQKVSCPNCGKRLWVPDEPERDEAGDSEEVGSRRGSGRGRDRDEEEDDDHGPGWPRTLRVVVIVALVVTWLIVFAVGAAVGNARPEGVMTCMGVFIWIPLTLSVVAWLGLKRKCPDCERWWSRTFVEDEAVGTSSRTMNEPIRDAEVYDSQGRHVGHTERWGQVTRHFDEFRRWYRCRCCGYQWSEMYSKPR